MNSSSVPPRRRRRPGLPLDQLAVTLMVSLVIAAILLIVLGDHATARVQTFSWQDHTVGAENGAFVITFNRPMDPESVAANLAMTPLVPGRISWSGRRMAYTLNAPIPYGETFAVELPTAQDRFSAGDADSRFEGFTGTFQSRDRAMAYIGTEGEEQGRLMLVNFSQGDEAIPLTPATLTVLDFEPYPLGDRLLFSAIDAQVDVASGSIPALYSVKTGIAANPPEQLQVGVAEALSVEPGEVGSLTTILQDDTYQNLAFDLSPNGRVIVVQRVNLSDPSDFGPWVLRDDAEPQPLATEPGGEFLIAPDNQTLLMLQGQGTAVIPLDVATIDEDAESETADASLSGEPLDFLPEFGRVFDVSGDGAAAAMVNFNQNDPERRFTESLVVVTNQGEETELLNVTGSILNAQFSPTDQLIYVLASELLPGEDYREQPFLTAVNRRTQQATKLISLPPQSRIAMSLAPDGLAALLEVVSAIDGAAVPTTQTLLLPLFDSSQALLAETPANAIPQVLPYAGSSPTWLP